MMPEGPECKITTDQIAVFEGWTITEVNILSGRYTRHGLPQGWEELTTRLPVVVDAVRCKGKFIYFLCTPVASDNVALSLWNTLAMSGKWTFRQDKDCRVHFRLAPPASVPSDPQDLYYSDLRNFGTFRVSTDPAELEGKLASIGPSLLEELPLLDFLQIVRKQTKRRYLAVMLMDQGKVSGIGNYILSEALYRSMTDPFARVGELDSEQWVRLYHAIVDVMTESYRSQGVTRLTEGEKAKRGGFASPSGSAGNFAMQLQVYGQERDPSGRGVIRETGPHKRTIWYVEEQLTDSGRANRLEFNKETPSDAGPKARASDPKAKASGPKAKASGPKAKASGPKAKGSGKQKERAVLDVFEG